MDGQIWTLMAVMGTMAWVIIVIGKSTKGGDEEARRPLRLMGLALGVYLGLLGLGLGLWAGLGGLL